jgi:hypothetical protein
VKRAIRKIKAMKTIQLQVSSKTMKTKSKVMKTKNNVQKTILRFAAVVISLVLISFTVSAQGFWKKLIAGSSFNAIALAMVDHTNEVPRSSYLINTSYNYSITDEADETLSLEPWMLNDFYSGKMLLPYVSETENSLEMEDWMLNEKLFEVTSSEKKLELEEWMISSSVWK